MSDLSSYRDKVAILGKQANDAEKNQNYEEAYLHYTKALDIFMHMIKCKYCIIRFCFLRINPTHTYLSNWSLVEKNPKLVEIYK